MKILLTFLASIFVFLHLAHPAPPLPNTNLIGPTASPTLTPEPTLTQFPPMTPQPGWQTYSNSLYKYSLQYPSTWTLTASGNHLTISPGTISWIFIINPSPAESSLPQDCSSPDACSYTHAPFIVMRYPVDRIVVRTNLNAQTLFAYLATPSKFTLDHPGFGQTASGDIKYWVKYQGPQIEKYLDTLDGITASLQPSL